MAVTAIPRTRMSEVEWRTRVDLAACYRLVDLFGWSDLPYRFTPPLTDPATNP